MIGRQCNLEADTHLVSWRNVTNVAAIRLSLWWLTVVIRDVESELRSELESSISRHLRGKAQRSRYRLFRWSTVVNGMGTGKRPSSSK